MEDALILVSTELDYRFSYLFDLKMIFCFFSGLLTTFIGLNFLINFKVLKNEVKKMSLKNLVSGMFAFVSIILNNKNLIFNFDKKIFSLTESNEDQVPFNFDFNSPPNFNSLQDIQNSLNALKNYKNEYDYFDSFFTGENLFKFFLIVINFVPIIFNSFWADLFYLKNKGNFLVKNLIPNPVFLSIITILMKYFLIENFKPQGFFSFYNIINFTCYFMCIAFVIYEFYLTKNFSFWSIFYLILILLNFIAVSFIQIQPPENLSFKGLNEETPNKFVSQGKYNLFY